MQSRLTNKNKLLAVKTTHTIVYLVMVVADFYILYAGITKTYGTILHISLALLSLETIVFFGNGMKCPFTALAKKYGDTKGHVGDLFFPESFAKYTFWFFGTIFTSGLVLLALDYLNLR